MENSIYTGKDYDPMQESFPYICKAPRLRKALLLGLCYFTPGAALLFFPAPFLGMVLLAVGGYLIAIYQRYRVILLADELILTTVFGERHIPRSTIAGWEVRASEKFRSVRYIYLFLSEASDENGCSLDYTDVCDSRLIGWLGSLDAARNDKQQKGPVD